MTGVSAIDLLVHHCVILQLNIPSHLVEQVTKARKSDLDYGAADGNDRLMEIQPSFPRALEIRRGIYQIPTG